jgi:hypothetical protein
MLVEANNAEYLYLDALGENFNTRKEELVGQSEQA